MKDIKEPNLVLLIKCALEAGAKIIKNNAGFPAGIYVQGKSFDIEELFNKDKNK